MNNSEKLKIVNEACGFVNHAKFQIWNQLCALNDDPLHKEINVLLFGLDLHTLHEVRALLHEHPEGDEEVTALLECLQGTVFRNITNCIVCITQAAARESAILDDKKRLDIKHNVEGALMSAARSVRRLFETFGLNAAESQL
ncbi:MAG: hypothetical protein JWM56_803 [Candidatus Peribacteria bacterium]|nr:hypothetical protein [Candidatus Peribacteria bacterium]